MRMILRLVELLGAYSNQDKLLKKLQNLLQMEPSRPPEEVPPPPKQVQHRLTAKEQSELLRRYLAGERAHVLAKAYDINRNTVAKLLQSTGLRRPRSMTEAEITEATQLYNQGWSCQRIGDHLGRDHSTVWLALRSAGVQLRRPWER